MLTLAEMRELADGAQTVRPIPRELVKTRFTKGERDIVKHFFHSLFPPRQSGSDRMQSFFALCNQT